nr:WW domain-containing adapter protein with coiled-coil-like [Oryctolagus cuniculus]
MTEAWAGVKVKVMVKRSQILETLSRSKKQDNELQASNEVLAGLEDEKQLVRRASLRGTPEQPPREPAGGVPLPCGSGECGRGNCPSTEVEGIVANPGRTSSKPGRAEQTKEQRRVLCRSSTKTGSDNSYWHLLNDLLISCCIKGTSYSPQENSHNHSALHSSNSHSSNPSNNSSKTSDAPYDSADDCSEHISSSGKKYYYNCRTEVSQWEKPKEWLEREQRQKEANKMAVNSFPKDRDYRREVMQATATSGFASGMEDKHSSDASSLLPQNILSQTSRHNDRDYRLPRADTHSSSAPVQHPIKPVVHPAAAPGALPSSPFTLQSDHQPKKSFDANGASTLSKLPIPTSSVPAQKTERKESAPGDKAVSHSCTTPSTSSASGLNPTSAPPTSASAVPVSPVPQSPIPPLLQDPNLLRQLLPALQATLQLNNSNVDISKVNEGKFS